ncbi:MAG: hypothetical protein ABR968_02165 [Bacteroidales bacterium]
MKKILLFGFLICSIVTFAQKRTIVSNNVTLYDGTSSINLSRGDTVTVLSYKNNGFICKYVSSRDFTGFINVKNLVVTKYMLYLQKLQKQDSLKNDIRIKAQEINEGSDLKEVYNKDSIYNVFIHTKPFWVYDDFSVMNYIVTDKKGKNSNNCQILGPIGPDEKATFENDILFSTGAISYYKLSKISVQYIDNTIKYFNYSDIKLKR